jgi:hypothetical protein
MIGTEFIDGQGLGNQLFCYVTARAVAEENGYEFGTAGQECFAVNIHSNRGMYFMDIDLDMLFLKMKRKILRCIMIPKSDFILAIPNMIWNMGVILLVQTKIFIMWRTTL